MRDNGKRNCDIELVVLSLSFLGRFFVRPGAIHGAIDLVHISKALYQANKAVYSTTPVAGGWAGAVMPWAGAV